MTPEQQKAIALARARRRRMEAQPSQPAPQERGIGATIYDNIVGNPDDGVQSYGEQLGTWLNRAGESMTLGVVGDEASAAATGMLPGRTYEGELERYRGNEENMSTLGKLSADLTGAIVPAVAGLGVVSGARTLGQAVARGMGFGATAGTVQGFAEGEGGIKNRVNSGIVGTLLGGTLGGAAPLLGAGAKSIVSGGADMLRRGRVGSAVGSELGVSNASGRVLSDIIGQDDPAALRAALARSGPSGMLADVSPQATGALDMAMRSPVPAARTASQAVEGRASQAFSDVTRALDQAMGAPAGIRATQRGIAQGSAPARRAAYDAAYAVPIDYSAPAGSRLLDELTPRIPQQAINYANTLMRTKGEKSAQIMASVAEDGTVSFTRPPDVRQWDYIKQGLDMMAESGEGAGALGGQTRVGSAYQGLSREIRDAVKDAVPEYGDALKVASDAIGERNAVDFGSKLLRTDTTPEMAAEAIQGATDAEIAAMRQGVRSQLQNVLGDVRKVASDQNLDARQASKAFGDLSSENAETKLSMLMGEEWPALKSQLDQAGAALGLRARTSVNSATFGRTAAESAIVDEIQPSALRQGQPIQALKDTFATAMGASPEAIRRMRDDVKGEIADVLTRQGIDVPQKAIDAIVNALAKNPINPKAGDSTSAAVQALLLGNSGNLGSGLSQKLTQAPRGR
jgi:hypothetical protein